MNLETKRTSKEIVVRITDLEIVTIAKKAANIRLAKVAIEEEFGRVKSAYKGRIEEKETELNNALVAIREGQEKRIIDVEEIFDYARNTVETRDGQDGRLYDSRAMTAEERQIAMDFDEKKASGAQRELSLRDPPVDLNSIEAVTLPDPSKEGDEHYVTGNATKQTHVTHGVKTWVLGVGEPATFVAHSEDVFGTTMLVYERETIGQAAQ